MKVVICVARVAGGGGAGGWCGGGERAAKCIPTSEQPIDTLVFYNIKDIPGLGTKS